MIPRVVHKALFLDQLSVPPEVHDALRTWQVHNPRHELRVYLSEAVADEALRTRGLWRVAEAMRAVRPHAAKVDVFRLGILWAEGGWYSDWKQECLETGLLDRLAAQSNHTLVTCLDKGNAYSAAHGLYQQAFVGAPPGDPCVGRALNATVRNVRRRHYGETPLDPTGPGTWGRVVRRTCRVAVACEHRDNLFYDGLDPIVRHKCSRCARGQDWNGGSNYNTLWRRNRFFVEPPPPPPLPPASPPPLPASPPALAPGFSSKSRAAASETQSPPPYAPNSTLARVARALARWLQARG